MKNGEIVQMLRLCWEATDHISHTAGAQSRLSALLTASCKAPVLSSSIAQKNISDYDDNEDRQAIKHINRNNSSKCHKGIKAICK